MKSAFILVNPFSKGGKGQALWREISEKISAQFKLSVIETTTDWEPQLVQALANGTRLFIAAGGDGTVNELLNALMRHKQNIPLCSLLLGAIGLGSSNDFHKPYTKYLCISSARVPVKLNCEQTRLRDVGVARFCDDQGVVHTRFFLASASIGVVAEANQFFNSKQTMLAFLKRRYTFAAICYAALKTILFYRPFKVSLSIDGKEISAQLNSLNVLKTQYVSGSFCLDIPIVPNDGRLGIALMENMNLLRMLKALADLSRGRFAGKSQCSYWFANKLKVNSAQPFALELDGEVITAREVCFTLFSETITECL